MRRRKLVVTGATGLLGSYLLPMLKAENDVWAISQNPPEESGKAISWVKFDLAGELSGLRKLLPDQIDAVIHLAQSPFFRDFPDHAQHVFNVNVNTTMYLLDLARTSGCSHFINASSGGVYAFLNKPLVENGVKLLPAGSGFYPISKQCGELLVNAYANLMHTFNLRFFFIYGRGQKKNMLMPRLVDNIKAGRPISLQGNQGIQINPVHATDAAKAVMQTLQLEQSATINIAGPEVLSLCEIGKIIGKQLDVEPKFKQVSGEPKDLVGDVSAMKLLLCEPEVQLSDGIQDLL